METIFNLYIQSKDPNFIGQDTTSREIIELASNQQILKNI